jgi:hypothetical protein
MTPIVPIYISSTNMIMPLTTIKLDNLMVIFYNILQIIINTTCFIVKEGVKIVFTNLTLEKIVYIIILYNLLIFMVIDSQRKKMNQQKKELEYLEEAINYYNRNIEEMRNKDQDNIILYELINENSTKMKLMDRKLKKIERDIKIYE